MKAINLIPYVAAYVGIIMPIATTAADASPWRDRVQTANGLLRRGLGGGWDSHL